MSFVLFLFAFFSLRHNTFIILLFFCSYSHLIDLIPSST